MNFLLQKIVELVSSPWCLADKKKCGIYSWKSSQISKVLNLKFLIFNIKRDEKVIIGNKIPSTFEHVKQIQEIFQTYGNLIKTRLGIHDVEEENVSPMELCCLKLLETLMKSVLLRLN